MNINIGNILINNKKNSIFIMNNLKKYSNKWCNITHIKEFQCNNLWKVTLLNN